MIPCRQEFVNRERKTCACVAAGVDGSRDCRRLIGVLADIEKLAIAEGRQPAGIVLNL